jgi:hypothetical protein
MWTCSLFVRSPAWPRATPSRRAGLHRRQLGAFVIEPANFGKWFEVPPDALECAPKPIQAASAMGAIAQAFRDFSR